MQGNSGQYQALIYNIVVRGTPPWRRLTAAGQADGA